MDVDKHGEYDKYDKYGKYSEHEHVNEYGECIWHVLWYNHAEVPRHDVTDTDDRHDVRCRITDEGETAGHDRDPWGTNPTGEYQVQDLYRQERLSGAAASRPHGIRAGGRSGTGHYDVQSGTQREVAGGVVNGAVDLSPCALGNRRDRGNGTITT